MGSESSWLFKVTSVRPAEASCLSRSCKLQRSESLKTFALFSSGTSIIVWSWSLLHSGVKIRSNSPGRHGADGDKASSQISCGKISCSPSFWTGSLGFACSASSGFAGSTGGLGMASCFSKHWSAQDGFPTSMDDSTCNCHSTPFSQSQKRKLDLDYYFFKSVSKEAGVGNSQRWCQVRCNW